MRWSVVAVILLAGCASSPAPTPDLPDPTQPLHGGADPAALYMFGPQTNGTADGQILVAKCGDRDNVWAYRFTAPEAAALSGGVTLKAPKGAPNATSFLMAAFIPSTDGLKVAQTWRGGSHASIRAIHEFALEDWAHAMPETISVPVGADGQVRVAIACRGEGAVNFVIGGGTPLAPDYLDPVVASGFDAFLAHASEELYLTIPPTGLTMVAWSTSGNVQTTYEEAVGNGVRVGRTGIDWTAGAGWTHATCSHDGWADHGTWSLSSKLHGSQQEADGLMAYDIATLWLSQSLLFGFLEVTHSDEGSEDATLSFNVEHLASADIGWQTRCEGAHFGATLTKLFGDKAEKVWITPRGLV